MLDGLLPMLNGLCLMLDGLLPMPKSYWEDETFFIHNFKEKKYFFINKELKS